MPQPDGQSCSNCQNFFPGSPDGITGGQPIPDSPDTIGQCRLYPPAIITTPPAEPSQWWVKVYGGDWCGHWKSLSTT